MSGRADGHISALSAPLLFIPGLTCTAEILVPHLVALWAEAPVMVASPRRGRSMAEIARHILADAPPRFALAGFSMGGYLSFEILRQAPERVERLALIDTQARADTAEATERRRAGMALAQAGKFGLAIASSFPNAVHPDHQNDESLRALHTRMALAIGPDTYRDQQEAIIGRSDSRDLLPTIGVPTTVLVGEGDLLTPPALSREMADAIPHARLQIIAGAGHMALAETPMPVQAALVDWLRA